MAHKKVRKKVVKKAKKKVKKAKKKTVVPKRKKAKKKFNAKMTVVMREFKNKTLDMGKSGKKVKNRKQAVAIAYSVAKKESSKKIK